MAQIVKSRETGEGEWPSLLNGGEFDSRPHEFFSFPYQRSKGMYGFFEKINNRKAVPQMSESPFGLV
jgi:hypothetical protein